MLDKIIDSCQFLLNNFHKAKEVKEYLNSRINEDTQNKFKFGFFPDLNNLNVLIDIVGEDLLREEKLLYNKYIEDSLYPRNINFSFFDNHPLIMPFRNPYGEIIAIVGRTILDEKSIKEKNISKYKNTVFKKGNYLFGLYENKRSILNENSVYIVEGQFDVIKAVEKGYTNIVALGTNNMSAYQFSLITRYTNNIFLLLDNDEGGEKGRKNVISKFGKFANIQNFYLPDQYKDIDEYFTFNDDTNIPFTIKG